MRHRPPAGLPPRRKCYYPGALALYAELDRCFARRYQAALHRLRMQQRRHPVVLPGAPLGTLGTAATVPTSGDASGCEDDPAGGSPRAQDADATPPPEPSSEPTFSWGRSFGRTESSSGAAAAAAAAAEQAAAAAAAPGQAGAAGGGSAPDLAMAASIGARPTPPIPVPVLRHNSSGGGGGGGGSLGRPPRSPRPGPAPPRRAAVLGMSPQSSRQLPAGEPLLSPSGMSPQSSSGALLGPDDGGSSLAGSTWGASSLQTQAPRGASGTAELADTLTSRLRPLVTSASGGGPLSRHAFTQQRSLSGGSEGLVGPQPQPPFASVQPHQEGSNLVFLSARPESYKARRKRVSACGARHPLPACPPAYLAAWRRMVALAGSHACLAAAAALAPGPRAPPACAASRACLLHPARPPHPASERRA